MTITQERRLDPRVQVQVRLVLVDERTGQSHLLRTVNLSASGARCLAQSGLEVARDLSGMLFLPVSEGGRTVEVALPVRAHVVRSIPSDGAGPRHGLRDVGLALDMDESDRDDLRRFLLEWMAADSWTHVCAAVREA